MDQKQTFKNKKEFVMLNLFKLSLQNLSHEQVIIDVIAYNNLCKQFPIIFEGSMITQNPSTWVAVHDAGLIEKDILTSFFDAITNFDRVTSSTLKISNFENFKGFVSIQIIF